MMIYLGGYQIISACYRLELKFEAKQFLKSNPTGDYLSNFQFDLKNGEIDAANFEWEEKGKEFKFNNKMYDVVQINEQQQQVIIYCYNDSGESKLEQHLDEIHQKQNNPKASSTAAFQKLISLSFESVKLHDFYLVPTRLDLKFNGYEIAVLHQSIDILVPPPDQMIVS